MAKRKLRVNPVMGLDEAGLPAIFTLPYEALYFESVMTTTTDELRVQVRFDKIITEAEGHDLIVEQLLYDDDDKMDLIKRLRKTGQWLK